MENIKEMILENKENCITFFFFLLIFGEVTLNIIYI